MSTLAPTHPVGIPTPTVRPYLRSLLRSARSLKRSEMLNSCFVLFTNREIQSHDREIPLHTLTAGADDV